MKICTKCKVDKSLDNFGFSSKIPKKYYLNVKNVLLLDLKRIMKQIGKRLVSEERKNIY